MDTKTEQRANDMLQALAGQRNQYADAVVNLSADLAAANRRVAELEEELAKAKAADDRPAASA